MLLKEVSNQGLYLAGHSSSKFKNHQLEVKQTCSNFRTSMVRILRVPIFRVNTMQRDAEVVPQHKQWLSGKEDPNTVFAKVKLLCYEELNCSRQHFFSTIFINNIQSTLIISNSKGLYETLRDIRTST